MAKKIRLTFTTEENGTLQLSIADPADGLTMTEVKAAAEKICPVLATSEGVAASAFKSAVIIVTSEETIPEA